MAPIDRLAEVELHLCMHCLDLAAFLRFARCSRPLYAAASKPFAVRTQPLLSVQRPTRDMARKLESQLLRHVGVSLQWRVLSMSSKYAAVTPHELALLCATPRIREFNSTGRHGITDAHWNELLSHAAFRNLTALHVDRVSSIHLLLQPFGRAPKLHEQNTNLLRLSVYIDSVHSAAQCTMLACHPSLTHLSINVCSERCQLAGLGGCKNLSTLELFGLSHFLPSWSTELASPSFRSLQHLTLGWSSSTSAQFAIDSTVVEPDWTVPLANLQQLRTLHVKDAESVHSTPLLRALHVPAHCPALEQLVFPVREYTKPSLMPDADELLLLLQKSTQFCAKFAIGRPVDRIAAKATSSRNSLMPSAARRAEQQATPASFDTIAARFAGLFSAFPERVSCVFVDEPAWCP